MARAKREGMRSRAAYKLIEIDDKHRILKPGGAWSISARRPAAGARSRRSASARRGRGRSWRSTSLRWRRSPGVAFARSISSIRQAPDLLKAMLDGGADVVLSDMAANATGHKQTDHLKIMALVEAARRIRPRGAAAGWCVPRPR